MSSAKNQETHEIDESLLQQFIAQMETLTDEIRDMKSDLKEMEKEVIAIREVVFPYPPIRRDRENDKI